MTDGHFRMMDAQAKNTKAARYHSHAVCTTYKRSEPPSLQQFACLGFEEYIVRHFSQVYRDLYRRMMVENSMPKKFVFYDPPLQLNIGWGNRYTSLTAHSSQIMCLHFTLLFS